MMDCIGRDGEDGTLGEMVVANGDAGAGRNDTGKAQG